MSTGEDVIHLSKQFARGVISWDHWRLYICEKIFMMKEEKAKEFALKVSKLGEEDSSNV